MGTRFIGKCFCYLLVLLSGVAHANTVTYVYTDPQGTPLAEADANGNITATFDYTPYGSQALGAPPNGPGYTGHVNDPDTGLVYMQARYYDPATGRFLSVDPVVPAAANVFNFGRYVYGNNNPIKNTDPNGRQVFGSAQDAVVDNSEAQANSGFMLMCQCDPIYKNLSGTGAVQQVVTPVGFGIGSAVSELGGAASSIFSRLTASATSDLGTSSFFEGASYTPKVMMQMSKGPGEFHSFPELVKNFESSGTVSKLTGGDGTLYQKLEIPGSYSTPSGKGSNGNFEFIKDADGNINHRLFVPEKPATTQ